MTKKIALALLSLWIAIFLSGCEQHIKGSGTTATENRTLSKFDSLRVVGNYKVNIVSGTSAQASITADNNIIPYIETKSRGETLIIDTKRGYVFESTQIPQITLTASTLEKIGIIGNGVVNATGINADAYTIKIIGAGGGTFAGTAKKVEIKLIGSGTVSTTKLITPEAVVKLVGAGKAAVYANEKLTVKVSGAGKIQYYGSPKEVDQKIAGSGEVIGIADNAQKNPS